MKAPSKGAKFETPDHRLRILAAEAWSMWSSLVKYTIKFANNPKDAILSNVSFPAHQNIYNANTFSVRSHAFLTVSICLYLCVQGRSQEFCLGAKCDVNIFIKTTSTHIYTHMCAFLLYIHTFYLISYIYTHNQKKKKKSLVFSIKIIFDGDLS